MPQIFIVDDSISVRKALEITFKRHALSSSSAVSGEEALEILLNQPTAFDLLMVDVVMPGMSGLELCSTLRQQPRFQHLPVILMSGTIDDNVRQQAHEVGASGVLRKPFSPEELLPLVEGLMPAATASGAGAAREAVPVLSDPVPAAPPPAPPTPPPAAPPRADLQLAPADLVQAALGEITAILGQAAPAEAPPAPPTRQDTAPPSRTDFPVPPARPKAEPTGAGSTKAGLAGAESSGTEPAGAGPGPVSASVLAELEGLIAGYRAAGTAEGMAMLDARHQVLGQMGEPLAPKLLSFAAYFVNTARVIGQQLLDDEFQTMTLRYGAHELNLHVRPDFTLVVLTRRRDMAGKLLN